ncbi:hypothetical protein M153_2140003887 [Pseudoloma neurophilia]|uniref:Uncharacterized protein n=1 Tax=Pseudoloma neurophilia TaxID=146866 RepID=A0A0R0LZ39_9MICR|nr:hypothetical protein M153_2140003887 [Pseudoloma neurophilia]
MPKYNENIAHIEKITINGCTCEACNVDDSNGNRKEYPSLDCNINCKKNEKVEQKCFCFESDTCQEDSVGFESSHLLSLEKLKTSLKGNSKSEQIIKNCIDGGDDELKFINISFENTVKNGTLTAQLHVTRDNDEKKEQPTIDILKNINFPIDIFKNQTKIKIGTEEINQNSATMTNKDLKTQNDLLSQNYDEETENFCKQIGEDFFEDGNVTTALIGSLFFVSALFIGLGFLYKKYRKKTTETNPEVSNNVI